MTILRDAPELREGPDLTQILELLCDRRAMDLSDLPPEVKAALTSARSQALLPSAGDLAARVAAASAQVRKPVPADGTPGCLHRGRYTAKIGDPSGRTADRPPLRGASVARSTGSRPSPTEAPTSAPTSSTRT